MDVDGFFRLSGVRSLHYRAGAVGNKEKSTSGEVERRVLQMLCVSDSIPPFRFLLETHIPILIPLYAWWFACSLGTSVC